MKRGLFFLACAGAAAGAAAQNFAIEGAVLDSRTSQNLGVTNERGQMAEFFRAQKAMTFGILRAAGIPLDQLSPEVRARIERFQTTNLDAFRAFSQGLDLKDQGRYQEAKEAFRRAAELDPGFQLAVEQQQAMPDVNVTTSLQLRAVVAAASTAAVDRGKASFTVDLSRAVALLAAGQSVVAVPVPADRQQALSASNEFTSNPPGSSGQFLPNLAAGLAYSYTAVGGTPIGIGFSSEYRGGEYVTAQDVLESVETTGSSTNANERFAATRAGAAIGSQGNATLSDGTRVYWGQWLSSPGASAAVTVSGAPVQAPTLGPVDFMFAEATRQMPTTGTATFTPTGGSLQNVSGTIGVNFVTRDVALNNLGFTLGGLAFSNLGGSAKYSPTVASGVFSGNYTQGSCPACGQQWVPTAGSFGGNFVGRDANGLIFTTILPTGSGSTVSGVQLFGH
jgi:hypothetical protein